MAQGVLPTFGNEIVNLGKENRYCTRWGIGSLILGTLSVSPVMQSQVMDWDICCPALEDRIICTQVGVITG